MGGVTYYEKIDNDYKLALAEYNQKVGESGPTFASANPRDKFFLEALKKFETDDTQASALAAEIKTSTNPEEVRKAQIKLADEYMNFATFKRDPACVIFCLNRRVQLLEAAMIKSPNEATNPQILEVAQNLASVYMSEDAKQWKDHQTKAFEAYAKAAVAYETENEQILLNQPSRDLGRVYFNMGELAIQMGKGENNAAKYYEKAAKNGYERAQEWLDQHPQGFSSTVATFITTMAGSSSSSSTASAEQAFKAKTASAVAEEFSNFSNTVGGLKSYTVIGRTTDSRIVDKEQALTTIKLIAQDGATDPVATLTAIETYISGDSKEMKALKHHKVGFFESFLSTPAPNAPPEVSGTFKKLITETDTLRKHLVSKGVQGIPTKPAALVEIEKSYPPQTPAAVAEVKK